MQKSFIASLALSFVLAFATVSYLAAPPALRITTAHAEGAARALPDNQTISFQSLNLITIVATSSTSTNTATTSAPSTPQSTETQTLNTSASREPRRYDGTPLRVVIPAIQLDSPVVSVGLNNDGEMDVPSGDTNNVGWYMHGTRPGNFGSAVLDAHVYAAFSELHKLQTGDVVYVDTTTGERLAFRVDSAEMYQLGELTSRKLFARKDARRLNLITCAGEPTGTTYTHRLVVFTTLID